MIDKIIQEVLSSKKKLEFRNIPTGDIDFEVREYPPHVRHLLQESSFEINRRRLVPLQLPYVQYAKYTGVCNHSIDVTTGFYMSFSNKPIKSLDDTVFIPPLEGCGYRGSLTVCLLYFNIPRAANLDVLIEHFWNGIGSIDHDFASKLLKIKASQHPEQEILKVNWSQSYRAEIPHKLSEIPMEFLNNGVPH